MTHETRILIHEMLPDERPDVEALFARSLGLIDRIAFLLSFEDALKSAQKQKGGSLVAVCEDRIVGSISLRTQAIRGKQVGFIDAFVTERGLRGKGIGSSLVDAAISWLEGRKCDEIYATADRYNSPSWNTFIHRRFAVYEFPQQFRDYGLGFLRLWLSEFHFLGFGTFFLRRSREEEKPTPETAEVWHYVFACLAASLVWLIPVLRSGKSWEYYLFLFVMTGLSILVHERSQRFVARRIGLETTFRVWESGILFSSLLATIGSFFPAYGSTYVRRSDYWYDARDRKTGAMFVVGPLASLALAVLFRTLSLRASEGLLHSLGEVGYTLNLLNAVFNLVPIQAAGGFVWDGRKILSWNKAVWFMLLLVAAALVVTDVVV